MYSLTSDLPPAIGQVEFYVLLVLAHEDAHAYWINRKIQEFSKGSIKLRDGSIYRLIRRMTEQGLLELAGERPARQNGRATMHYCLSHHGRTALRYELERLEHALKIARSAGLLDQPPPTEMELLLAAYQVASS